MLLTILDGMDPCTWTFSLTPHPSPLTSPSAPAQHHAFHVRLWSCQAFSCLTAGTCSVLCLDTLSLDYLRASFTFLRFLLKRHLSRGGKASSTLCTLSVSSCPVSLLTALAWHTRLRIVRVPLTDGETPRGGECTYPFTAGSPAPRPAPKAIQTLRALTVNYNIDSDQLADTFALGFLNPRAFLKKNKTFALSILILWNVLGTYICPDITKEEYIFVKSNEPCQANNRPHTLNPNVHHENGHFWNSRIISVLTKIVNSLRADGPNGGPWLLAI